MLTRDPYVALLQKRAAEESSIPSNDSAEATYQEYSKNMEDNRQYLHGLFDQAGSVQSHQTSEIKKLFPSAEGQKISGHPLLKVATDRTVFFVAVEQGQLLKTAAPIHLEVAYQAFMDEIEKIAALKTQNAAQVAKKNQIAMARPAKAWNISPMSVAGKATAGAGTGTTLNKGGIMSRLSGLLK